MEKKNDLSNSKINPENTNDKAESLSADDLKKRFKAGSIPLQTDYEQLIDIADIGRKAVGQVPGAGLKLDDNGTLNLKMGTIPSKDFSPLILEKDILSVDLGSGLINEKNGISVGQGNGIVVNAANVAVKADNGISVDGKGVSVKAGNGISVGEKGVEVKAKDKGSISVDSDGIAVKCWDGGGIVVTDNTGLYLKLEGGNSSNAWSGVSGLSLSTKGVKVKAGNGIKVDDKGVSIDPNKVLPRGMIVMFSGNNAPPGWAFCDGGTYDGVKVPDLRNRFIMCGKTISEKGESSKAEGDGNNKNFSKNTTSTTVSVSVKVENTNLDISQIPKHYHIEGLPYFVADGFKYGNYHTIESKGDKNYQINNEWSHSQSIWHPKPHGNSYYPHTSEVGEGKGHDHQATVTVDPSSHSHRVDVIPPYYLLAFIMKL
ncbi:hypothetical protein CE143_12785 [Photorhabdus luminescens]|uniref:Phage tail collar domain-containing protein n=1 Tax=Photorhabdus akhurstii TaxID=171438 RepID=A0ABX8LWK1_9GAMM|nr:tail fiber protein [Photorhabdus akhurstii]QXF33921.1 hypothetical protein B0X70_12785 [Photorhabdus akhurstii]UJD75736.1 hypothetical protein CE143_12785 [Photorhabdus luminescens]